MKGSESWSRSSATIMMMDLPRHPPPPRQFSVAALLEFTAVCSLAAAGSPIIGGVASGLLMAAALAVADRRGGLALGAISAALLAADHGFEVSATTNPFLRQTVAALSVAAIVGWFRLRRCGSARVRASDCA